MSSLWRRPFRPPPTIPEGNAVTQRGGLNMETSDQSHHNVYAASHNSSIYLHYGATNITNITGPQTSKDVAKTAIPSSPMPSQNYVHRDGIEDHMTSYFFDNTNEGQKRYILHGPGASGKTQLARSFVHVNFYKLKKKGRRFSQVYWLEANCESLISQSLKELARSQNLGSTAQHVLDWLASHDAKEAGSEWIIVFNDADDPTMNLEKFFPRCSHGNILVTTRNYQFKRLCSGQSSDHIVSEMTEDEALSLLMKFVAPQIALETERGEKGSIFQRLFSFTSTFFGEKLPAAMFQDAAELVRRLQYYPLSICQAGTYISTFHSSPRKLIDLLAANPNQFSYELDQLKNLDGYRYSSIQRSWAVGYKKLTPQSKLLMHLIAHLPIEDIRREVFENMCPGIDAYESRYQALFSEQERTVLQALKDFRDALSSGGNWDTVKYRKVAADIQSHSFASFSFDKPSCSFHPLLRNWVLDAWREDGQVPLKHQTLILLACSVQLNRNSREENTEFFQSLAPVVDQELTSTLTGATALEFKGCLNEFSFIYQIIGRSDIEVDLREKFKQGCEDILGKDHDDTMASTEALAATFHRQGRVDEAATLKSQLLESLGSIHYLAETCYSQGRYEEAAKLGLQAVEGRKRLLGEEHLDMLTSIHNLGVTYQSLGRVEDAAKYKLLAVVGRTKLLGADHLDTLASIQNLGVTYHSQGRYQEAAKLKLQAVEGRKRQLGEEQLHTLASIHDLGVTYRCLGRYEEAAKLFLKAIEGRKKVLGEDHADTLASMNSLGVTYRGQGRYEEAIEFYLQAIEGRKKLLGEDHPDTLNTIHNLGVTYFTLGRYEEAAKHHMEAVTGRTKRLGEIHPDTLSSIHELGVTYRHQECFEEAVKFSLQAIEGRKRLRGECHPSTLNSIHSLGETYRCQGHYDEATKTFLRAIDGRKKRLGEAHPNTINSIHSLSETYHCQGRHAEAAKLRLQAFEGRRKLWGEENLDTLSTLLDLVRDLLCGDQLSQAEIYAQRAVSVFRQRWGLAHEGTQKAVSMLNSIRERQVHVQRLL